MINLNLISENYKDRLKYKNLYLKIKDFLFVLLFFVILAGLILIIAQNIMQSNFNDLATLNSQLKEDKLAIAHEIASLNLKIKTADDIQQQFIPWSEIISDFDKAISGGIEIHTLKITRENWTVQGEAINRETLLKFKSKLEKNDYFNVVKSPITNLLQKNNLDFELQMTVKTANK